MCPLVMAASAIDILRRWIFCPHEDWIETNKVASQEKVLELILGKVKSSCRDDLGVITRAREDGDSSVLGIDRTKD